MKPPRPLRPPAAARANNPLKLDPEERAAWARNAEQYKARQAAASRVSEPSLPSDAADANTTPEQTNRPDVKAASAAVSGPSALEYPELPAFLDRRANARPALSAPTDIVAPAPTDVVQEVTPGQDETAGECQ